MKKNIYTAKLLLTGGILGLAFMIGTTSAYAQTTIESRTDTRVEARGARTGAPTLLENLGAIIGIGTGAGATGTATAITTQVRATTTTENNTRAATTNTSSDESMMLDLSATSSAEIETQIVGLLETLRDKLSQLVRALEGLLQ